MRAGVRQVAVLLVLALLWLAGCAPAALQRPTPTREEIRSLIREELQAQQAQSASQGPQGGGAGPGQTMPSPQWVQQLLASPQFQQALQQQLQQLLLTPAVQQQIRMAVMAALQQALAAAQQMQQQGGRSGGGGGGGGGS